MKIGVLQFFSWPERRVALETVYKRALERIEIMDRTGFDAVWLAEHHFSTFSVCPSVHMMGTMAAARTTRLRIGTAVSLAALYHPLRLAEEVALLDMLSGGRVNWGAGRGFSLAEFNAFGVPPEDSAARFREAVEIVLQAWTHEKLTYDGAHFNFDKVEVLPKPLQRPHPPVWMAATSDPAIDWAASRGFSILMDPHSSMQDIGRKRQTYLEKLAAAGFAPDGRDIPMARLIALADTPDKAEQVARRGAQWLVDSYAGPQHRKMMYAERSYGGLDPVEHYLRHVVIHGTPESVVDRIAALQAEIGLNYLMCAPLSHDSFVLLAEKIVPRLA
jgi:alkanesulfonate monooxygenase SsuD/methylene tetrahydromethanopterin reductase-like flavin-dependent oxidoreductase (luciferase family)